MPERNPRMILLTNSIGQVVPYDRDIHRSQVLNQLTEFDIWPDLNDCHQRALQINTMYADLGEDDFMALKIDEMKRLLFAHHQNSLVNEKKLADEIIDGLIASGDIFFGAEEDRLAQIVPEPEDYSQLPEADTRHPNNPFNPINIAKRRELEAASRAEISSLK